jgi:hypothetical protein
MLLCYIALFDLIRKSDLFIFYSDKWHPTALLTTDNAGNCRVKCFMICLTMVQYTHLYWLWMYEVLNPSCIGCCTSRNRWYVFFKFLQCAFVYNWIDLTHTMLLYSLIHFRFLKGYHSHTYIDSYCRKYLMHLVLLYINKLMVCL